MEIEAVYEHGKLEFLEPVQFKHDRVRLLVTVADEEIDSVRTLYNLPQEVVEMAEKMRGRLDEIRNAPLPPDDELPPVSDKFSERMEAFSMREDR